MLKCKICGNYFNHLGSHIWHKHKILAKDYKEIYGLDHKFALITKKLKQKKQRKFWENPIGLKNLKKAKNISSKKAKLTKWVISVLNKKEEFMRD